MDIELVEPLEESCIWCQARGAATEISGMEYKVIFSNGTFCSEVV